MKKNDSRLIYNRIKLAYGLKTDKELADLLKLTPQGLATFISRNSIKWEKIFSECTDLSIDWLLTEKGEMLQNSSENWKNCLKDFLLFKMSEGLEKDTIKAYNSKIKKFCCYLSENDIESYHVSLFTYERATQFMVWLQENNCRTKKTLREYRYFLSEASEYLRKRRLIRENVFDLLPTYKGTALKPTLFSDSQLKEIKEYCLANDRQLWTICQFVLYCFFRPNKEVRLMKVGQIDFKKGLLWSNEMTSKNNKKQAVVIPQHFLDFLINEGYCGMDPDDYMFTISGRPGKKPIGKNYIHKHFKKVQQLYDIKTYLYALKHTGNRKLKDMDIDLLDIMKQNRHYL